MGIRMAEELLRLTGQKTFRQVRFFEKTQVTPTYGKKAAIYYVDNPGQLLNLSEPQFIDLLDKDNDIYFDFKDES